ncbi:hypothetical protein [Paenibacillus protaetiae]|uniref:DUF4367 domain-containing protein n=1 Tax=Paenibacillus protaetiae TaxID=2509456 RepID=A0A4V0YFK8_9BACL|nr:hypothetical protein [Paenibacillus protaetiae]QAY68061.1 hypothetical protein ET464_18500 [Paenibacillus protaetiae]
MKKLSLLFFLVWMVLAAGCQNQNSDKQLVTAQNLIDNASLNFQIPKLDGYDVSSVQLTYPPKENQGAAGGNHLDVLVAYTANKGELIQPANEQNTSGEKQFLYGPYEGNTAIEITYSNRTSDLDSSETIDIGGNKLQKAITGGHTFLLFHNGNGSILMNYNHLDDETISKITAEIVKQK